MSDSGLDLETPEGLKSMKKFLDFRERVLQLSQQQDMSYSDLFSLCHKRTETGGGH